MAVIVRTLRNGNAESSQVHFMISLPIEQLQYYASDSKRKWESELNKASTCVWF